VVIDALVEGYAGPGEQIIITVSALVLRPIDDAARPHGEPRSAFPTRAVRAVVMNSSVLGGTLARS